MAKVPGHLWLLGLSGSGKSTVGKILARDLHVPWIDTDEEITREADMDIPQIFQTEGEEGFRNRESRILEKASAGPVSVVSCGAGIILREANRSLLASTGTRIYLKSDPATLVRRLHAAHDRPLLAGNSRENTLRLQLEQRAPYYEESEIQMDVSTLHPQQTAAAIREHLPAPWSR
jgi:shikimate kinase